MRVLHTPRFKFLVRIQRLRVLDQVEPHGVPDRVRERRLLAHEDLPRNEAVLLEGVPQQVFADAVAVQFFGRVDRHAVSDKREIAEGHPRLQRVHADAAVRPQHVVHVELADPLLRLRLECLRGRRKICVLVPEDLVRDLTGQEHADIRVLVDPLAEQVHSHGGPDRRDVVGPQRVDDLLERRDHLVPRHEHFVVLAPDILRDFPRVLEVDRVLVHPDGKSPDRPAQHPRRHAAHQRRVQPARQEEPQRRIGVQPLFYAGDQLVMDVPRDLRQLVATHHLRVRHVFHVPDLSVCEELHLPIGCVDHRVLPGRERHDLTADPHQVLGLGGQDDRPHLIPAKIQRPDPDRITRSNILLLISIVYDHRELRVQRLKHTDAHFLVERQNDLAV